MAYYERPMPNGRSTGTIEPSVLRSGAATFEAAADLYDDIINPTTQRDVRRTVEKGSETLGVLAQEFGMLKKHFKASSQSSQVQPSAFAAPGPSSSSPTVFRQPTSTPCSPHAFVIVTAQNPCGYHPSVVAAHCAIHGDARPLPPVPSLPGRHVRFYGV